MILTVSETGFGRLSLPEEYRFQHRGGKGVINYHVDKFGLVAGVKVVSEDEDIILISEDGVIIRIPAADVRVCARPSKGVRVMRVSEDSRVVTLSSAPKEETQEEDSGDEEPEASEETPQEPAESSPAGEPGAEESNDSYR